MMNAAGTLASGFIELKGIIDDVYKSTPISISVDKPYSFELEEIEKILKE